MPMPSRKVAVICEVCGQEFTVKPSLAKNRHYCSWACRTKAGESTKVTLTCQNCGQPFVTYRKFNAKYCSISCGISARNKTEQNPSYKRDISGENNPMYGRGLNGPTNPMHGKTRDANPAWRGGRKVRKDGYVLVIAPEGYHNPISSGKGKTGYVLEHRLVMEQHLGRYLEPHEVIHHIDGDPTNNNIENLQLFSSQQEHITKAHGKSK